MRPLVQSEEARRALSCQLELLSYLLPEIPSDTWRQEHAGHPAVIRWNLLKKCFGGSEMIPHTYYRDLRLVSEAPLDGSQIMAAFGGDARHEIGKLANYGDDKVQKKVRQEALNPVGFLSKATEICRAAQHQALGHEVHATEARGRADFRIVAESGTAIVECKRLSQYAPEERFWEALDKANGQIGNWRQKDAVGIVVLDVADRAGVDCIAERYRADGLRRWEAPPNAIKEAVEEVGSLLTSNRRRNISVVVLTWNEVRQRPYDAAESVFELAISRRLFLVHNRDSRVLPSNEFLVALEDEKRAGRVSMKLKYDFV